MGDDLLRYFRMEALESLEGLTRGLLDLERSPQCAGVVDQCFRLAHTLKGSAHVAGQRRIAELAHEIEGALAPHRGGAEAPGSDRVRRVLALASALRAEVATLEGAPGGDAPPARDERLETVRVEIAAMDALLEGISEAAIQLGPMRRGEAALGAAQRAAASLSRGLDKEGAARPAWTDAARWIEGAASGLGELSAALAQAQRDISTALERIERELTEVQRLAGELRLVPMSAIFSAIELAARDAAESMGKPIDFKASGEDVRIEAHVLASVRDTLLHLVRNAVVHGIEPSAERARVGKPPLGRVRIEVERRGRRAVFRCVDDGRGLDEDALRRAAVARGLISAEEAAALSREEALHLALRPGVSTSPEVTELSGRGVGLDVARDVAARFDGEILITSEPGEGTRIDLTVPLSLSSLRALSLLAGPQIALIPLDAVQAVARLQVDEIHRGDRGERILFFEGQAVPFAPLSAILGAGAASLASLTSGALPGEPVASRSPGVWSAVLVRASDRVVALGVDQLLGAVDVLVKPLPAAAGAPPVIAGAALDAQGDPMLVLDPRGLTRAVGAASMAEDAAGSPGEAPGRSPPGSGFHGPGSRPEIPPRKLPILVIDDSLTTRVLEQSILEAAGYEVDLAGSGEEALEKAAGRRYGLFLVDVQMPGMGGLEFTRTVRADPALRAVPIIILTSLASPTDRERGLRAGAAAYIVKGEFEPRRFLRTVAGLLK